MEDFYLYIVQVNIALLVFCLLYRILFARDTFLEIRRWFLLTVVFLAFTYPVVSFSGWFVQQQPLQTVMISYAELLTIAASSAVPAQEAPVYTWQNMVMLVWTGGMLILFVRMMIQFIVLCRMAFKGQRMRWKETEIIAPGRETAPFSFFGWIFIDPACYEEKELSEIVAHEKTHVRQWHSLDMLMGEMLCLFFWFNPIVWIFRREIRQNLEFLADKQVVRSGYNRKNYQYHLLRLSHQSTAVQIVNNFNVSQLKRRIIMMNKKQTSRIGLIKYALLLPVTGLLILSANANAVAGMAGKTMVGITAVVEEVTAAEIPVVQETQKKDTLPQGKAKTEKKNALLKGKVIDENGKPIQGVSVIIRNTSDGTVSMENGEFELRVPEAGVLCFSFVGRKTQEVPFTKDAKDLKVVIQKDNLQLEGVVVTGYRNDAPEKKKEIFMVVEDMPQFVGESMQKYLARNIKYPVRAMEKGIEGTVYVSFIIDQQGKVTAPKIAKGVAEALDKEAIRVVTSMPDWKPGKQRGKPVDVEYTIPIDFRLVKGEYNQTTQIEAVGMKAASVPSDNNNTMIIRSNVRKDLDDSSKIIHFVTSSKSSVHPDVLYIVDGEKMPAGFEIKSISVESIKEISVLKDSSAVVMYGKEGNNGVIVIRTK